MNDKLILSKDEQIQQQGSQIEALQGALETSEGIIQKLAQQLVAKKANVGGLPGLSENERAVIAKLTGLNVSDLFGVVGAQANINTARSSPEANAERKDENLNSAASEFSRVLKKLDLRNITLDVLRDGINDTCQSLFMVSPDILSDDSKGDMQGRLDKMNDPVQFETLFLEIINVLTRSGVDLPPQFDAFELQKKAVKMVEREFNIEKRKEFSLKVGKITDVLQNSPKELNLAEVKKQISDLAGYIFLKYSKKDDMEVLRRVIKGEASNEDYVDVFQNAINIAKRGIDIEDMEDNLPQLNVGIRSIHYSYDMLAPLLESTANPTRTEIADGLSKIFGDLYPNRIKGKDPEQIKGSITTMARLIEKDPRIGQEDLKAFAVIFNDRFATPANFASVVAILFKYAATPGEGSSEGKLLADYDDYKVTTILDNLKITLRGH